MTTAAAPQTYAERVREAWEGYRIACLDVDVADYEETELIAWDLLQHELREAAVECGEVAPESTAA